MAGPEHRLTCANLRKGRGLWPRGRLTTLTGQGTTLEDMERTGRYYWIASVADAFRTAQTMGGRVHLFPFSMEGLLAIDLAARHPLIATLTLLDTPHKFRKPSLCAGTLTKHVQQFHYWEYDGRGLPHGMEQYAVGYKGFPVNTMWKLVAVRKQATKRASDVKAPAVVIQSEADENVDPINSDN
jgi:esterase/lipase